MPRYDLKCFAEDCDGVLEVQCSHADLDSIIERELCPKCSNSTLERVYSAPPAPHFKGSGFYATDYKGKK